MVAPGHCIWKCVETGGNYCPPAKQFLTVFLAFPMLFRCSCEFSGAFVKETLDPSRKALEMQMEY